MCRLIVSKTVMSTELGRTDVTSSITRKKFFTDRNKFFQKLSTVYSVTDHSDQNLPSSVFLWVYMRLTSKKMEFGIEKPLAYFFGQKVSLETFFLHFSFSKSFVSFIKIFRQFPTESSIWRFYFFELNNFGNNKKHCYISRTTISASFLLFLCTGRVCGKWWTKVGSLIRWKFKCWKCWKGTFAKFGSNMAILRIFLVFHNFKIWLWLQKPKTSLKTF